MANIYFIRKPIDQTIESDTSLGDDYSLRFPIGVSETWMVWLFLQFQIKTTSTGIKYVLTAPAGAVVTGRTTTARDNISGAEGATQSLGSKDASVLIAETDTSLTGGATSIWLVRNGATAGDVQLQWAQRVSDAAGMTVYAGSLLMAIKV